MPDPQDAAMRETEGLVEQVDRDAADKWKREWEHCRGSHTALVHAFARHRLAATEAQSAEIADLRLALAEADRKNEAQLSEWNAAESALAAARDLVRRLRKTLEEAPEPYEYMSKSDFNHLPFHMRSFVDAHKTWMNKVREALADTAPQGRS